MTDKTTTTNGLFLAEEIHQHLTNHVRFTSDHEANVLTLWALHTHALDAALATPYMCVTSPIHSCGKTTLLALLSDLVANQASASNTSIAALFRTAAGNTVLLDEVDTMLDVPGSARELQAVLNAGYARSNAAGVARCAGETFTPTIIDVFGAKLIAGIDLPAKLSSTTLSRCVEIRLERALPTEQLSRYGTDSSRMESTRLAEAASTWAGHAVPALPEAALTIPVGLDLRWKQIWEPLFAIAESIGGDWAARTAAAYRDLVPQPEDRSGEAVRVNLLIDLRKCFYTLGGDNISTERILDFLNDIEGGRWRSWGRRRTNPALDARDLADILRPFDIKPKTVRTGRLGGDTAKGYRFAELAPKWERFLGSALPEDDDEVVYDEFDDPNEVQDA